MTAQEAIELLDNLVGMIEDNHNNDYDKAFKMGIEALEKQIPKEPIPIEPVFMCYKKCPNCNESFDFDEEYYLENGEWSYCGKCGQKLDWSATNEH